MNYSASFHLLLDLPTGEQYQLSSNGEAMLLDGTTSQNSFKPTSFEITRNIASKSVNFKIPRLDDANGTLSFSLTSDVVMNDIRVRYSIIENDVMRPLLYGRVSEVKTTDAMLDIKVTSFFENLKYSRVVKLSNVCRNELGDSRCGVPLANFTSLVNVTAVDDDRLSFDIAETLGFQDFQDGYVRLIFPGARELKLDIAANDENTIYLWEKLPLFFGVGQQFNIIQGCGKVESVCKSKFDNFLNFGGLPVGINWSPTLLESIGGVGS